MAVPFHWRVCGGVGAVLTLIMYVLIHITCAHVMGLREQGCCTVPMDEGVLDWVFYSFGSPGWKGGGHHLWILGLSQYSGED